MPLMNEKKRGNEEKQAVGNTTNCFVCVNILYILINILWPNGNGVVTVLEIFKNLRTRSIPVPLPFLFKLVQQLNKAK